MVVIIMVSFIKLLIVIKFPEKTLIHNQIEFAMHLKKKITL